MKRAKLEFSNGKCFCNKDGQCGKSSDAKDDIICILCITGKFKY